MNRIAWIVVGLLAAASLVACSLLPGSPPAPLVVTRVVTVIVTVEPLVPPSPTEIPPPTPTPVLAPTETPIPVPIELACGGSGKMQLLLLGENSPEDVPPRGADAIRLVKVDFDNNAVTILAMPPDLWVNTPNLAGVKATTLNQTYLTAKNAAAGQGERAAMVQGTQAMAQALSDNFGYQPDHYVTLNQQVFTSMVDTLGGIEVNVPVRLDPGLPGHGLFEAGLQVFNGQEARNYTRIVLSNSQGQLDEWARFERQNQVLAALRAKIMQPDSWSVMPQLVSQFANLVVTDLSPSQLLDLNCMIAAVGEKIIMLQVGQDMLTVDAKGHLVQDGTDIQSLIEVSLNK